MADPHPEIGHRILASVPFMAEAAEIVLCHEERFDGSTRRAASARSNPAPCA